MASIVRAEKAAYRYPQHNHGLAPISLSVEPGERVLVTGPSGCGKSTLARCLTGLIPHLYHGTLEGEVWLDSLRTADAPLWQLAERAGLVFQNPAAQMLAHSVEEEVVFGLENLGLPRQVIGERVEETLARFGLREMRERSPQTLSGGEQQKLALAAITARQPPVLVLDEPLSMLDGTAADELVAHLADLADAGTAVIACEHREEYLQSIPGLCTLRLDGPVPGDIEALALGLRPAGAVARRLEVEGLSVSLGGRPILRDLGFSLESGQVVAVVGRNGVGKTTLLRALAGLQKHEGSVRMNGSQPDHSAGSLPDCSAGSQPDRSAGSRPDRSASSRPDRSASSRPDRSASSRPDLGLVFQNADLQLFNASVREEILFRVPDPDMELYAWLLAALGLACYEQAPPLLLSEGEKKRVALATVLMRRPRHGILLDEPSLGQDAAHKAMLVRLARSLAGAGQLVILTTHDLPLAAQADRLLLLGPDGFVAGGPPAEVLYDEAAWASLGLSVPDWVLPALGRGAGGWGGVAQGADFPLTPRPPVGPLSPGGKGSSEEQP
jgi:energy-coupling factor transporter ATP-binding protein EcfA2